MHQKAIGYLLLVRLSSPYLVAHDDVVLEEDEEECDGEHVGLAVVRQRDEDDEGHRGDERALPLEHALHELAHAHELHDDGLDPHHVVQEDLEE